MKGDEIVRDKNGSISLREVVSLLCFCVLVVSWIADQFYNRPAAEHIFYTFASICGAGLLGYSLEKKQSYHENR